MKVGSVSLLIALCLFGVLATSLAANYGYGSYPYYPFYGSGAGFNNNRGGGGAFLAIIGFLFIILILFGSNNNLFGQSSRSTASVALVGKK